MFGHITLGCDDWERAKPFWSAVMDVLGHPIFMESDGGAAFGTPTGQKSFIGPAYNGEPAQPGNGVHIAYLVDNRATVDAFYAAALANGGTDEGPPGLRPHYHPNYYGAYVRDPDGNKLQAVCHSAKG